MPIAASSPATRRSKPHFAASAREARFAPPALFDLTAIADHIRERNPAAAARVRSSILKSLDNLTVFPRMGRKQTTPGVRKLVTRRYSYLVYYRVDMEAREVVVLRIRYRARKRKYKDA